jgi:hypothetical protein
MKRAQVKYQVANIAITAQTTNNDYTVTSDVTLDGGFDEVIGVGFIIRSKSFANYSGAASNISENFDIDMQHQDGEIYKSLAHQMLEFSTAVPISERLQEIEAMPARNKVMSISIKKTGTAKDLDSASIGGTVTSTYSLQVVFKLVKWEDDPTEQA